MSEVVQIREQPDDGAETPSGLGRLEKLLFHAPSQCLTSSWVQTSTLLQEPRCTSSTAG
ncbi:hypothetical protein [Rhizobium binxianense]